MTNTEKFIEKRLDGARKTFCLELNLEQAYNRDEELKGEYHGRELFELLQNVDDAYEHLCQLDESKKDKPVEVLIEYKDNVLRVCNMGEPFSSDAIQRLCQGGVSSKGKEYIGNKGIGFRSILNWAKEIHLYSGDFSIGFSEKFAQEQFEFIKDNETVKKQLAKNPSIKFPILRAPKCIEKKQFNYRESFATIIEIIVDEKTQQDNFTVKKQIEEFNPNILLFLPNITKVSFVLSYESYSFCKTLNKQSDVMITSVRREQENTVVSENKFYLFSECCEIKNPFAKEKASRIKLAIAIPMEYSPENKYQLYTFFPIRKENCPFHVLMHATFLLSSNRDTFKNDKEDENVLVFKELLEFYVKSVTAYFCKPEFGNLMLKLLCPINFQQQSIVFDRPFSTVEISNWYFKLCREHISFQTVNGNFIKIDDNPKIISVDVPTFFKGNEFSDLLCKLDDTVKSFAEKLLGNAEFTDEELCERINKLAGRLSIAERAETFIWWAENRKQESIVPLLLKDDKGDFIQLGKINTYFFSAKEKIDVPNWADIRFIDKSYEDALVKVLIEKHKISSTAKDIDIRDVRQYLNGKTKIHFGEFSAENIISPINTSVDGDFERAKEYIQFLYKNSDTISDSAKSIKFQFPNAKGGVSDSKKLYFGTSYGNDFAEKLFKETDYEKLCSPALIGIDDSDVAGFKEFLKSLGIVEYPRIEEIKIGFDNEYWNLLKNVIGQNTNIESVSVHTVKNIQNILKNLESRDIIKWIYSDYELKTGIMQSERKESIKIRGYKARYDSAYIYGGNVPCYLTYIFSTTKWLEINGKKYAPSECIFSEDSVLAKYAPCITKEILDGIRGAFDTQTIKYIFSTLGVKSKPSDLHSQEFYSLLLKLQNDGQTAKISQSIYRESVKDGGKNYADSEAKREFFKNGKVWTKNRNGYQSISEVFFSGSSVINVGNKYLIDLPLRTGSKESVKKIYNIEPYEEQYTIDYSSIENHYSKFDEEFQKHFSEFLPYVFCYRKETASDTEKRNFKNLKISLVNRIVVINNDISDSVKRSYTLLQDLENPSQWFIFIDDSDKYDKNKLSELLQQIFAVITNTQNKDVLAKYGELFAVDDDRRNFLIEQEFLNHDVLIESRNILKGIESGKDIVLAELQRQNKLTAQTNALLNQLSFSNLSTLENQKLLFDFLKAVDIDVSDFQKILDRTDISVKKYNALVLQNEFSKNEEKFKTALFLHLREQNVDEQKQFLIKIDEYKYYPDNVDLENSVNFDAKKILSEAFSEIIDDTYSTNEAINIEGLFSANLQELKNQYDSRLVEEFIRYQEWRSLLYFDYPTIEAEFLSWKENFGAETPEKKIDGHNYPLQYSVGDIVPSNAFSENVYSKTSHSYKAQSNHSREKSNEQNQAQGDAAEELVFNSLDTHDSELEQKLGLTLCDYKVDWKSEAATRKANFNGRDDLGYDIELIHKSTGEKIFIEVKSSTGMECAFEMSRNEYKFANAHKNCYRIIFVGNMNATKVSVQVLPTDIFTNSNFQIVPEKIKIIYVK